MILRKPQQINPYINSIKKIDAIRYFLVLLVIIFGVNNLPAQSPNILKDTSYTVNSTWKKIKKKYPYAHPVKEKDFNNIQQKIDIVYYNIGNRRLHADLYFPKNVQQLKPGILMIHGGGWTTGDKSLLSPMAKQLASEGYFVMNVEYRLSPEAKYPAAFYDLKAALSFMRKHTSQYGLDTARIAVLGTSAGAQLASLIGTTGVLGEKPQSLSETNKVQCIVNIDGILAFIHPESAEDKSAGLWLGGSRENPTPSWEEASALNYANQFTPPTLFIASSYPRFHAGRDDMMAILDQYNIYSEKHFVPDSPHSFWLFDPWFDPTLSFIVNFLHKVF